MVEAWVDFRFAAREEAPEWDEGTAEKFLEQQFDGEFATESYAGQTQVQWSERGGRPTIEHAETLFERVRACNKGGDRYIQAGRDLVIYNILRKQQQWPSYEELRDEAVTAYKKYVEFTSPESVTRITLAYRDIVSLEADPGGTIKLNEHLRIYPEVPESLNPVSAFRIDLTCGGGNQPGDLRLTVQNEPPVASHEEEGQFDDHELRFRLDWRLIAAREFALDPAEVTKWLDEAHASVIAAFRSAFTQRAWDRFKPRECP